jgi:hypothetical protein
MIVKIQQRSVYHKFTEIEIEVPKDVQVDDWILNNEDLWSAKMDEKHSTSKYVFGTGLYDIEGMDDAESDSEWRYQCPDGYGGHL